MTNPVLKVDTVRKVVYVNGEMVRLTPTEWYIVSQMWGLRPGFARMRRPELCRWHIRNMRKKLWPVEIEAAWGRGWRLTGYVEDKPEDTVDRLLVL